MTVATLGALLLFASCAANMWIPMETQPRPRVTLDHVRYLDELPTKPYDVVGIITPETGSFNTEAEAVQAMREEAARHGADAIFVESKDEKTGWSFSRFGGGSFKETEFRAKAIVWK